MNKNTLIRLLAAATIVSITPLSSTATGGTQYVRISITTLPLVQGEKITGFEIHVQSGRIARVKDVPTGWEICLHNEPSWRSEVNGSFAAASMAIDTHFFRDFIVVEKDNSDPDTPFEIHGEIIASVVSADTPVGRRIKVSMKDFTIKKVIGK